MAVGGFARWGSADGGRVAGVRVCSGGGFPAWY